MYIRCARAVLPLTILPATLRATDFALAGRDFAVHSARIRFTRADKLHGLVEVCGGTLRSSAAECPRRLERYERYERFLQFPESALDDSARKSAFRQFGNCYGYHQAVSRDIVPRDRNNSGSVTPRWFFAWRPCRVIAEGAFGATTSKGAHHLLFVL